MNLVGTHLKICDKKFEVVNEFAYLGVLISNQHDKAVKIKRRIISGTRAFYGMEPQLSSKKLSQ